MSEDLKAIIKRSAKAWNTGDLTIVDEIFAKDFVNHNPSDPSLSDLDSRCGKMIIEARMAKRRSCNFRRQNNR